MPIQLNNPATLTSPTFTCPPTPVSPQTTLPALVVPKGSSRTTVLKVCALPNTPIYGYKPSSSNFNVARDIDKINTWALPLIAPSDKDEKEQNTLGKREWKKTGDINGEADPGDKSDGQEEDQYCWQYVAVSSCETDPMVACVKAGMESDSTGWVECFPGVPQGTVQLSRARGFGEASGSDIAHSVIDKARKFGGEKGGRGEKGGMLKKRKGGHGGGGHGGGGKGGGGGKSGGHASGDKSEVVGAIIEAASGGERGSRVMMGFVGFLVLNVAVGLVMGNFC
jgi:uncharacterized membrane protein YgcG